MDGDILGNVSAEDGLLTISNNGAVQGDVRAPRIVIDGKVNGNIYAGEHLKLDSRAVITGNVFYHTLEMTEGAQLNGGLNTIRMVCRKQGPARKQ